MLSENVDIHNHVLPGLDDGPQSMEDAILLVKNAAADGVTHIIATPHRNDLYVSDATQIKEAVVKLNREIYLENISIKVVPGQEIQFYSCLNLESTGELLTLANNGKYILLELPDDHFPSLTFDLLYQLQMKGYIPIIPHPERNVILKKQKLKMLELVKRGALLQISASSLIGKRGWATKRFTLELIKHNLVHFISSDAHHHIRRPFTVKKAYEYIRKKFSEKHLEYYMENAKHVLDGTEISPLPPIEFKKSR